MLAPGAQVSRAVFHLPHGDLIMSRRPSVPYPRFPLAVVFLVAAVLTPAAAAQVDARPGPPGSILLHAEGLWPHTGVPTLQRVERDGTLVEVFLEGAGNGGAAVSPWRFDTALDALQPDLYTVAVYTRDSGEVDYLLEGMAEVEVAGGCRGFASSQELLCLHGGRFQVRAWYRLAGGAEMPAHAHGLTADSGSYWFFRNDNLELLIKVLDGCAAFGRYWVFVAGLTDVGVRLEVTDTVADETWTYATEPGEGFDEVRDTDAFATCAAGS